MLFNSQQFVVFFAIVYSLYLLARDRVQQNIIILVASYVFYAWAAPRYLVLLIFYTLATFGIAIGIDRATTPLWRRAYLIAGIAVNLGVLGYFKYANFFITEVSAFLVHLKRSVVNVNFVDLDGEASALSLYPSQTIPDGHYNSRLAAFLGSKIGSEICNCARAANDYTISHSCQTSAPGCAR